MGKKQPRLLNEPPPSFAELYRMYEELLRLRSEVDTEETRALVAPNKPNHDKAN